MAADLGTLLDSSYLGDLAERSIGDVRAMRAECQEVESGMSLLRRLVQGRLDIVGLELRRRATGAVPEDASRSEEHTSELQSLMRISYAVFCLKKKKTTNEQ